MEKEARNLHWSIIHFDDLSNKQLYDLYHLRTAVFVLEQDCPYQEVDEKDLRSYHVLAYDRVDLIGVARIIIPIEGEKYISFGRVAIEKDHRGRTYAHQLTKRMLDFIAEHYPSYPIKISAQSYLQAFYGSHGFTVVSDEYLEDGIPHIAMQLSAGE